MPIRYHNLDYRTLGFETSHQIHVGDITANRQISLFVAPYDCEIHHVDIIARNTVTGTCASAIFRARVYNGTFVAMSPERSTSSTAGQSTSNDIIANTPWRILLDTSGSQSEPTTAGSSLVLRVSATGSVALSSVLCLVSYTPSKRRARR